jgi:tetratricopeptide (TPR) repeat protein
VGSAFRALGSFSDAIGQFREAVRLKPDWTPAVTSLAWLLATAPDAALRDANQAIGLAEHAADFTGRRDARALDVLAAAYAAAGQFDRAIATSQAALELKPEAPVAAAIRRRQELYRQHKPYVAPVGPSGI